VVIDRRWGDWEGVPTVADMEAWCFERVNDRWVEVDRAELFTKVGLLTEAEFDDLFGELPPLPAKAFKQPHPWRDAPPLVIPPDFDDVAAHAVDEILEIVGAEHCRLRDRTDRR
jgi:hypothetical protein